MIKKIKLLRNNKNFTLYFYNSAWLFLEKILRIISNLVIGLWLARYLGPMQFGALSYIITFASIFSGLAKLGLDEVVVRNILNHPEKEKSILSTAFILKSISAFILISLYFITFLFAKESQINLYILIISLGLFFQSFDIVEFYFQAKILARFISICKILQLAISSCLKAYLILIAADLSFFVWTILIDQIILTLLYLYIYKKSKMNILLMTLSNIKIAGELLKDAWPLFLSSILVMIYMRVDQLMIKEILGDVELGIYSAAMRLSEAWYFIPILITTSLFPALLKAKKDNEIIYHDNFQKLYNLMTGLSISVAIVVTFSSEWLISILYGTAYQKAAYVLTINIWSGVFVFMGVASGKWLVIENLQSIILWRTFYGMLTNVILNLIFIKQYGIIGAAISTLISQAVASYIFDLLSIKTKKSFLMKSKSFLLVK